MSPGHSLQKNQAPQFGNKQMPKLNHLMKANTLNHHIRQKLPEFSKSKEEGERRALTQKIEAKISNLNNKKNTKNCNDVK